MTIPASNLLALLIIFLVTALRLINVEIMVLLKYLSKFWRTLEMTPINCEINLILTDTKFYVPVVTLWTQDNAKQLH